MLVPAHDTYAGLMAKHAAKLGLLLDVPDLYLTRAETNTDVGAVTGPLDRGDVGVGSALEERGHGTAISRPDIDRALKTNGNLVAGGPIEEVQVVIVHKAGSIENTLGCRGNATAGLGVDAARRLERTVVLGTKINGLR